MCLNKYVSHGEVVNKKLHSVRISYSYVHLEDGTLQLNRFATSFSLFNRLVIFLLCHMQKLLDHQFFLIVYRKFAYWFQRAGAVFPQRTESAAPVFTPPQTQPLSSYPQNVRSAEFREEAAESSAEAEFPTLRYVLSPPLK